jgi:putative transposase
VLYTQPRPRAVHARANTALGRWLGGPYDLDPEGPGGWWILVEPGIELPGSPEVAPDLAGWRRERLSQLPSDEPIRVVPSIEYHRRTVRRPSHDYAGPGAWLITLKCFAGLHSFGEVIEGRMVLNEVGALVRLIWESVPLHHPNVRFDTFVVMPNHMHMILRLCRSDGRLSHHADRAERFGKPVPGSVSTIIRSFKSEATRQVGLMVGRRVALWQPRFDNRSLSDDAAVRRARIHIKNNPGRWRPDPPRPEQRDFELVDVGRGCELAAPLTSEDNNAES